MKALPLFLILFFGLSNMPALAEVPVIDRPEPAKTFRSPFNGEKKVDDQEGKDFTKLQQLHDLWRDDLRAEGAAGAHGSHAEFERAYVLLRQSDAAFHAALDQYVEDWSIVRYRKGYRPSNKAAPDNWFGRRFIEDRAKVMVLLIEHQRSVVVPSPNGAKAQPTH